MSDIENLNEIPIVDLEIFNRVLHVTFEINDGVIVGKKTERGICE